MTVSFPFRPAEHLGLNRIDLVEGTGRNPEFQAHKAVLNVAFSIEHLLLFAKNGAGSSAVDVLDNRGNLRMFLPESFHEIIFGGKDRRGRHQNHHDLPGSKTAFYQNMAEQAVSRVLIVGADLEGFQHAPDRSDDFVRLLILDPAGFHRNDPVTAHLVNAGDDISPSVPVKNCMDFVPIVIGLLHSFDGMDGADPLKKFFYRLLFFLQLFLVGHALILAASAFFRHRAEIFGSVLHRFVPLILRPEALLRYLWFAGR